MIENNMYSNNPSEPPEGATIDTSTCANPTSCLCISVPEESNILKH